MIERGIGELMTGRTSIVIAHRLSTVQRASRIVVIDAGKIAEMGRHDELLALRRHLRAAVPAADDGTRGGSAGRRRVGI